jgi:hypothetical protein
MTDISEDNHAFTLQTSAAVYLKRNESGVHMEFRKGTTMKFG